MQLISVIVVICALQLSQVSGQFLKVRQNTSAGTSTTTTTASTSAATSTTTTSTSQQQQQRPTTTTATTSAAAQTTAATTTATTTTPTGPPPLATWTGVPPLASISLGMATRAPLPVTNVWPAGASAPIAGAPALPTAFAFNPTEWPASDQVPPVDSAQVQAWMKELEGHDIPKYAPTVDGSCVNDTAAASDAANRGWWTCGGYTRATDIVACPDKLTWGVSFDDGPSSYTPFVLDYLSEKKLQATFFVVGSRVINRPDILIQEYMQGHEISIHTWSHRPLTSLTNEQIVAELGWTRRAIKKVLGVTPTTMRPPYGDIDDRVRAISLAMGLIPIMWTATPDGQKFDTNDWRAAGGIVNGTVSFDSFQTILQQAAQLETGFIVLQHDLFEIAVDLAVGYTLNAALNHNPPFQLEAIGQCSKIPTTNLYLESNVNTTFPYRNGAGADAVDTDGDGALDTKSGESDPNVVANQTGAGFITMAPFWTLVSVGGAAVVSLLL